MFLPHVYVKQLFYKCDYKYWDTLDNRDNFVVNIEIWFWTLSHTPRSMHNTVNESRNIKKPSCVVKLVTWYVAPLERTTNVYGFGRFSKFCELF